MQPAPRFQPPHTKNIIHCPRQNCGRIDFLGTTLRPSQLRSACCHCWLLALHVLLLLAASAHAAGSQHRSYAGAVVGRTYGVKRSAAHHSHDSCKRCGRCAVAWRCIIICALAARGLGQRATTWTDQFLHDRRRQCCPVVLGDPAAFKGDQHLPLVFTDDHAKL